MTAAQLVFLAAAGTSLLLSLAALCLSLRAAGLRFKPLWVILSLVGVGGAAMVWPAPEQVYWFFGVALPTVSFTADDGGWHPQTVSVLFPLGALLVFARLYMHRARATNPSPPRDCP